MSPEGLPGFDEPVNTVEGDPEELLRTTLAPEMAEPDTERIEPVLDE